MPVFAKLNQSIIQSIQTVIYLFVFEPESMKIYKKVYAIYIYIYIQRKMQYGAAPRDFITAGSTVFMVAFAFPLTVTGFTFVVSSGITLAAFIVLMTVTGFAFADPSATVTAAFTAFDLGAMTARNYTRGHCGARPWLLVAATLVTEGSNIYT
jgi:hypothetical protein